MGSQLIHIPPAFHLPIAADLVYNLALPEQWHMQTKMCICHAACRAIVWLEDTPSHIVNKLWEGVSLEKSFEHVFKKVYPYMLTAD